MKNEEICEKFVQGIMKTNKNKNLFVENGILYSYGYHFPLGIKLIDGYVINKDGYGQTTERHKTYLIRAITNKDNYQDFLKQKDIYETIILADTRKMKDTIYKLETENIKTLNELTCSNVIGEL